MIHVHGNEGDDKMAAYSDIGILTDIKQSLDEIPQEDTSFDLNILLHINAALSRLNQLGIGPTTGLLISDDTTTWNDLVEDTVVQGLARQFVLYSVKIGFDPPTSSFVLSALQEMRKELEFSLAVEHDRMVNSDGV